MTQFIVSLFDDVEEAQRVVEALRDMGIPREQLSVIVGDPAGDGAQSLDAYEEALHARPAAETAENDLAADVVPKSTVAGGVIGALAGALVSLGIIAIPGFTIVLAGGPLMAGLVGAASGATLAGLIGALEANNVSRQEATCYAEGVRRGGTLVAAEVETARADRVEAVMKRHNAVDMQTRADRWRAAGWEGYRGEDDGRQLLA